MAIVKDFTTPQGISANYHKLVKLEMSAYTGTVEMMLAIYANAEAAADGAAPLWHEYVRVPIEQFEQNPFAAFYPIVTTHPGSYLVGGSSDETPAGMAFSITDAATSTPETTVLEQMREVRTVQMRQKRDEIEYGTFVWDGSTFDGSAASVGRLIGAVMMAQWAQAASQSFSVSWTLADNSERVLTGSELVSVAQALGDHVLTAHDKYKTAKAAIAAATTIAEIQAVTWPA